MSEKHSSFVLQFLFELGALGTYYKVVWEDDKQ